MPPWPPLIGLTLPQIRALGFSTKTYTYDAFVGAFTLVVEVVMVVLRLAKRDSAVVSIAAELGVAGLLCIFWLSECNSDRLFTIDHWVRDEEARRTSRPREEERLIRSCSRWDSHDGPFCRWSVFLSTPQRPV